MRKRKKQISIGLVFMEPEMLNLQTSQVVNVIKRNY